MDKKIKLLSTRQVSKYLGLSVRTVQRLSEQGKIKAIKIGSYWKYPEDDISKYLIFGTNFSRGPARKPNNFQERRAYQRINSNFRCQYRIDLPPYKNIIANRIIRNISAGGVFIDNYGKETNNIEIDDPITLDFYIVSKDTSLNIKTEGRVVRKNIVGLGVKFRNIDDGIKEKIVQYIG